MHEIVPGAQLSGRILLDGVDVYGNTLTVTQVRRLIGMVFQKPNPFPAMSVAENVLSGLRLSGTRRQIATPSWRSPCPCRVFGTK